MTYRRTGRPFLSVDPALVTHIRTDAHILAASQLFTCQGAVTRRTGRGLGTRHLRRVTRGPIIRHATTLSRRLPSPVQKVFTRTRDPSRYLATGRPPIAQITDEAIFYPPSAAESRVANAR